MESKTMNHQRVSAADNHKNTVLQKCFHGNREVVRYDMILSSVSMFHSSVYCLLWPWQDKLILWNVPQSRSAWCFLLSVLQMNVYLSEISQKQCLSLFVDHFRRHTMWAIVESCVCLQISSPKTGWKFSPRRQLPRSVVTAQSSTVRKAVYTL